MEQTGMSPLRIGNMVVQGMQAPAIFTLFLILNFLLLGAVLASQYYLGDKLHTMAQELRLTQNAVQERTAMMIREGLMKPSDFTEGPTGPSAQPTRK
jgi:hypothetical protein